MVYLFGWILLYAGFAMQSLVKYQGRVFLLVAIIFFMILAFSRGAVGTDTANYERMLEDFVNNYAWDGREPGFVGMGWFLAMVTSNVELAVRLIAVIFFGVLVIFVVRSDLNERFMLIAYIMPAFAYQYSMNALRIGVGSVILLTAVQLLRRRGVFPALATGLTSVLFHYSLFSSLLFVVVTQISLKRLSSYFLLTICLMFVFSGLLAADMYIADKFLVYQGLESPNMLSGAGKILPILLIVLGVAYDVLPRARKIKLVSLTLVLVVFALVVTQYSYAGLRLLDLISFALPVGVLAGYSGLQMRFGKFLKMFLLLAGMVSVFAIYRGFLLEQGEGETPFLPYSFFAALAPAARFG